MEDKFRVHLCAKQERKKMTEICKVAKMLTPNGFPVLGLTSSP